MFLLGRYRDVNPFRDIQHTLARFGRRECNDFHCANRHVPIEERELNNVAAVARDMDEL